MRYLSVCSGIEAASAAWMPLGWKPWAFSEIEPFPSAVLAHHYPDTPNLGDMTRFKEWPDADLDLLCGGTPCQSFSNAGLRAGLDDPRGQLMLTFGAIAARYRPRWLVWENVPGVLSSNGGRDFASLLGLLSGQQIEPPADGWKSAGFVAGIPDAYGLAWRVLDAQFVRVDGYARAVPQRRQRVFVVGCLGDWRSAAAVLLEREGLRGDPAPRRSAGAGAAGTAPARPANGCPAVGPEAGSIVAGALAGSGPGAGWRIGPDEAAANQLIPLQDVSQPAAKGGRGAGVGRTGDPMYTLPASTVHGVAYTLRADGFNASDDGTGRGTPLVAMLPKCAACEHPMDAGWGQWCDVCGHDHGASPLPFDTTQITSAANRSNPKPGDPCHPLAAGAHAPAVAMSFDWQAGGGGSDTSFRGKSRAYITDTPGRTRALTACKTLAVHHAAALRRLMPVECERLQGFPPIAERLIVTVCTDRQSGLVSVALQCLRWQSSASPADGEGLRPYASTAEVDSSMRQADRAPLAVLHVLPASGGEVAQLHSRAKSKSSASGANGFDWCHRSTLSDDSAHSLALTLRELAHSARSGKAASPLFMMPSTAAQSGNVHAPMFGDATVASAGDAASDPSAGTFTTSDLGRLRPISDSREATLCCSALAAIAGSIPSETLPASFWLELTVVTPYTAIPYRGKPAADAPRYKALGNSWAINCARWVGQRINMVDAIRAPMGAAA